MIKHFSIFWVVSLVALLGCQSGNKDTSATATDDTIATKTDVTPNQNPPIKSELEDPDLSDTIPATAYGINTYGKQTVQLVKKKLEEILKDDLSKNIIPGECRKFIIFEYDLNDDTKKEIFVGLTGSYFCGTGGCTILLLNNDGGLITTFTVTDYPVIVSNTITKNWKDLILYSNGKNHLMKFYGKTYPSNPSVQPVYSLLPGDELPRALDFINEPYPWFKF